MTQRLLYDVDGVLVDWEGKRRTGIEHIQGTQDTGVISYLVYSFKKQEELISRISTRASELTKQTPLRLPFLGMTSCTSTNLHWSSRYKP
jgi:hypothetical protein